MTCTCPTASDYSTSHQPVCPWHRQFGGSSQRAHTGGRPITETTCDDCSCWCHAGINAISQSNVNSLPPHFLGNPCDCAACEIKERNLAADLLRLEREYWERVHLLACLTNCAENAEEIADKAVSAWRARWAK